MNLKYILASVALVAATSCSAAEPSRGSEAWMVGFWHMTADEDNGPLGGVLELRPDGTYVGYDSACNSLGEIDYHVYRGDIYVTHTVPGKGPISVILHPSQDKTKLTFTSPRTRNNAIYERVPGNKCVGQG